MTENKKYKIRYGVAALISTLLTLMLIFTSCTSGSDNVSVEDASKLSVTEIGEFASTDLDGNEITQEVFSQADITMINFWGTFCPPCIKEMPDIQKISEDYAGKAQVIGVPLDVDFDNPDSDEYKSALKILEDAGADFTNIKPVGGLKELGDGMQFVPTTIFVDSEGKVIGDAVVGANLSEYKARIDEYLKQGA